MSDLRREASKIKLDQYAVLILDAARSRSTCSRGRNAAVVVKDGRIIATGYAGAPSGASECDVVGHEEGLNGGCVRTVHAEANALIQLARLGGPSSLGATMYCTTSPCQNCAGMIVNAGITRVVFVNEYRLTRGIAVLTECGVVVESYP